VEVKQNQRNQRNQRIQRNQRSQRNQKDEIELISGDQKKKTPQTNEKIVHHLTNL
jgi:hypothetical protein